MMESELDPKIEAKKDAIKELIKMMQDWMIKSGGDESGTEEIEELEKLPGENEPIEEVDPLPGDDLGDLVKNEMKKNGKIKAPKSSMLAMSVKMGSPKKSSFKRYG